MSKCSVITYNDNRHIVIAMITRIRGFVFMRYINPRLTLTMGRHFSPKIAPSAWWICTPYNNTWFLGPARVTTPKCHLDQFSRFSRLTNVVYALHWNWMHCTDHYGRRDSLQWKHATCPCACKLLKLKMQAVRDKIMQQFCGMSVVTQ